MLIFLHASFEHAKPCFVLRQGNINSPFKSPSNSRIKGPRKVRGTQHKHTSIIVPDTLHLNQEFGFDSPRSLVLAIRSISTHRVDFVDKNNRRFFFSCQVKQRFNQFLTFSHILAHQVRRRDREKCTLCLSCASLR